MGNIKNSNLINYPKIFERSYKDDIKRINWASTNNVFLLYGIIKEHNLTFDKNLNKIEFGEDQLFFSKLNSYGHKIYWSKTVKVFEKIDIQRLNLSWLIKRSFRVGVVGHYIDSNIHGKTMGFIINYLKCIYYFIKALSQLFLFFKNKFLIKMLNYFFRSLVRLIGTLILKSLNFFRK